MKELVPPVRGFDIPYNLKRNYYLESYFRYWQKSLLIDESNNELPEGQESFVHDWAWDKHYESKLTEQERERINKI